jgi:hypothetical protein
MPGRKQMKRSRRKRFREQQQFWLDLNKPEDAALSKKIAQLKANREFSSTVRQGITLVMALREGDLTLLDEMFPQAVDEIFQSGVDSVGTKVDGTDVEEKLTALTTMVKRLSASSIGNSESKPLLVSGNLKALAGSNQPQDDLLEVKDVLSKNGNVAAQNLINSMLRSKEVKSDAASRPSKKVKGTQQSMEDLIEVKSL